MIILEYNPKINKTFLTVSDIHRKTERAKSTWQKNYMLSAEGMKETEVHYQNSTVKTTGSAVIKSDAKV